MNLDSDSYNRERFESGCSIDRRKESGNGDGQKGCNLHKEMIKAAKSGNISKVKELLLQDSSLISAIDAEGSTALHCATWKGHTAVVKLLLNAGAEVNARNQNTHWGTTPLHAAAHANHRDIAELLISHGADVTATNLNGRTPLQETEFHNAKSVAALLKQHGAVE